MCGRFILPKIPSSGQTNLKFLNQARPAKPHVIKLQTKCQFSPSLSLSLSLFSSSKPRLNPLLNASKSLRAFAAIYFCLVQCASNLRDNISKRCSGAINYLCRLRGGVCDSVCVRVVRQCVCADVRVVDSHYVCVRVCIAIYQL